MKNFEDYNFPEPIQKALTKLNFVEATAIQQKSIPLLLEKKDVIATAQTGTGKTAAFCLPALSQMLKDPSAKVLILVPTRELAQQIEIFWKQLTKFLPEIKSLSIVGGMSYQLQFRQMAKNPRMIIATPGRLLDHLENRKLKLDQVKYLVFDEADRMLDMGFSQDLKKITQFVPKGRQTLLFSATWDKRLDEIASRYLNNPAKISIGTTSQAAKSVKQELLLTSDDDKKNLLIRELEKRPGSVLIFTRTKRLCDRLSKSLVKEGFKADAIHGDKSQGQRNRALRTFRQGKVEIMVATDVVARGIDVQDIAHVINFNLPCDPEDYIHRIGRTGRAGATGQALTLVSPPEYGLWFPISELLKKTGSDLPEVPEELAKAKPSKRPRRRGSFSSRRGRPSSGGRSFGGGGGGASGRRRSGGAGGEGSRGRRSGGEGFKSKYSSGGGGGEGGRSRNASGEGSRSRYSSGGGEGGRSRNASGERSNGRYSAGGGEGNRSRRSNTESKSRYSGNAGDQKRRSGGGEEGQQSRRPRSDSKSGGAPKKTSRFFAGAANKKKKFSKRRPSA